MIMQDYKNRRGTLLQRMIIATKLKIDARIEARAKKRSQLRYVRLPQ